MEKRRNAQSFATPRGRDWTSACRCPPRDGDGNDAAHAVSIANRSRSIAVRRVAIDALSSARRFRSRRVARFARGVARQDTPRIFRSGNNLASACGCRPETYRAARRATVGFAATLAPTKVEVEAERQKAIFSLWCLRSVCGNGSFARPRGCQNILAARPKIDSPDTSANEIVQKRRDSGTRISVSLGIVRLDCARENGPNPEIHTRKSAFTWVTTPCAAAAWRRAARILAMWRITCPTSARSRMSICCTRVFASSRRVAYFLY